ncbi:MAG: hypothetical protein Q7T74_00115 [Candidatus Saccharibacteria bacterium]|nr:hypothetical protein [Candidatus Saccharibacteria bacterium]
MLVLGFCFSNPVTNSVSAPPMLFSGSSAYTPVSDPDVKLWLDTSQESYTNDAAIGQLTDWSGNTNHATQGTASAKPTFKTGVQNGLPVARCDGIDDWMQGSFPNISTYSIFVVCKRNGSHTNIYNNITFALAAGLEGQSAVASRLFQFVWDDSITFAFSTPVTGATALLQTRNDAFNVHSLIAPSGSGNNQYFLNGGNGQTTSSTETAIAGSLIFRIAVETWGTTYFAPFDFAEALVFDGALSTDKRPRVEAYLKTKWGITP